MAVAKKDQERVTYAWMYGQQARKDGKERAVPEYWAEHAEAWLQGFDFVSSGRKVTRPEYAALQPWRAYYPSKPGVGFANEGYGVERSLRQRGGRFAATDPLPLPALFGLFLVRNNIPGSAPAASNHDRCVAGWQGACDRCIHQLATSDHSSVRRACEIGRQRPLALTQRREHPMRRVDWLAD